MNIQLKKTKQGRRRFLKTAALSNSSEWMLERIRLKEWLAAESQFQQVGNKTYLERRADDLRLMLEVVGVPRNLDQKALALSDQEAGDILVYEYKNVDIFTVDLETIEASARKIIEGLNLGENKLSSTYHMVFSPSLEGEKIALHFFRQKDYSQNLL